MPEGTAQVATILRLAVDRFPTLKDVQKRFAQRDNLKDEPSNLGIAMRTPHSPQLQLIRGVEFRHERNSADRWVPEPDQIAIHLGFLDWPSVRFVKELPGK